MSWDIVLFHSKQKITALEDIEEDQLLPTDFSSVMAEHFKNIVGDGSHREVVGDDFRINYFLDEGQVSSKIVSLDGEKALYELVELANLSNWQMFDTSLGEMISLADPATNGYTNFAKYVQTIRRRALPGD